MDKRDFRRDGGELYAPRATEFAVVEVPSFHFLMIDGHGDPNTSADYATAVEALYALSYAAKFASKIELGRDYTVLPLEGLWYADDLAVFTARNKGSWSWTMMIRQPVELPPELWAKARAKVEKKAPAAGGVRLESFEEGASVQIMHVGPYDAEGPVIQRMHEYIADNGYAERGNHHELYIGDPRKSRPATLKTVLRQPVSR